MCAPYSAPKVWMRGGNRGNHLIGMVMRAGRKQIAVKMAALLSGLSMVSTAFATGDMNMRALGGGFEFGSALTLSQLRSNNFFYETTSERHVDGLLLMPAISLRQTYDQVSASLDARLKAAEFELPGELSDYTDGQVNGRLQLNPSRRTQFTFDAGSTRGHDPAGVDRTAGISNINTELDKWNLNRAGGAFRYGVPTALLNFELSAEYLAKEYTTNRAVTRVLDYNKTALSQAVFVNFNPKLAAVLELAEDFIDFDAGPGQVGGLERDAAEYRLRTGVRWNATAKTRGDLRVGVVSRDREGRSDETLDGFTWAGQLFWQPFSLTSLMLTAARDSQESFANNLLVIDNRRYGIKFSQGLSRNLRFVLEVGGADARFIGTSRKDQLENYSFSAAYNLRDHLAVIVDVTRLNRDSNLPNLDFDAVASTVGLRFSP